MTAKACFADGSGAAVTAGAPTMATTATIGRLDLTESDGQVRSVRHILPHPDRDLVLARLADEVPGAPAVPLGTTAPADGDTLIAAGYGRTADTWLPTKLHTGEFKVTAVGAGTFGITATSNATICKGDAGGPILRQSGSGYQLVGVHHRSWQGGCLEETSTRRDAVETRIDDIASWVADNAKLPNALQVDVTDTRIGVRKGDYGTQVREGALTATTWTNLVANAKDIVVAANRIGVLTHSGDAYVKEGAVNATFVRVRSDVTKLVLSEKRIGVITSDRVAWVKEGGLSAGWVNEYSGVLDLAITDTRIGVIAGLGWPKVKNGSLSAAWTSPFGTGSGYQHIVMSGDRVGYITGEGHASVDEGAVAWDSNGATKAKQFTLVDSGAKKLVLKDDRIGVLTESGVALVKEGAATNAFVTEYTGVRDLAISGSRVGVVTVDGAALVKHGGLSAGWSTVW